MLRMGDKLLRLVEMHDGDRIEHVTGPLYEVVDYLNANDLFSWILDEEPERELPTFNNVDHKRDLDAILKDYDYSWWTLSLEEV